MKIHSNYDNLTTRILNQNGRAGFSLKLSERVGFNMNVFFVQDYLKGIGGDTDEINYYQFCVLLDAGTGGNPSRVSSYLS